jgi:hypothetical protein
LEPTVQTDPLLGEMTVGVTTISASRLAMSMGDAVVEAASARAERSMVKNCIVEGGVLQ